MNSYIKDLEQYGEILTKEQMRIVCHISKRKATRLLQIGLVPCVNTGKATHTYLIKKTDVLVYLRDREVNPWRYEKRCSQTAYTSFRCHPALWDVLSEQEMRNYYEKKLASYPDVLTVTQITHFTGYSKNAVNRWIEKDYLRHLDCMIGWRIPKTCLLNFFCSPYWNKISRKSEKHMAMIAEMLRVTSDETQKIGGYLYENE